MKRWGWAVLALALTSGMPAQTMDTGVLPVATIKLGKASSLVTQKTFRDAGAARETATGAKMDLAAKQALLQDLVASELIKMDMDAQGIKVTDDELIKNFRAANPGMADAQIKAEVEKQSGQTWDVATINIKRQIANNKYFSQFPAFADLGKLNVSESEVKEFYDANTALFTAPDFVRVSHIFFDTKVKPKGTLAEIQKRAQDTLQKITSGQATFEEMATSVSEDASSAKLNGDIGYIPRTLDSQAGQQLTALFGKDFLIALFALKKGDVSTVLTSNAGLHIVRITSKIDKHFMTLDEDVYPGKDSTTVRTAIQQTLLQRKQMTAQNKLVSDVADGLRAKATIKTFEQNF